MRATSLVLNSSGFGGMMRVINGFWRREAWMNYRNGTATIAQYGGKKVDDCRTPVCDLYVEKAPVSNLEKCRVREFLTRNYFMDDPILKAAGLDELPPDPVILQYLLGLLDEGKTLYALIPDSEELFGVAICHSVFKNTSSDLRAFASKINRKESKRYIEFLAAVEDRANLYKGYQVDTALQLDLVCTLKKYRKRGICKKLMQGCHEMTQSLKKDKILRLNTGNVYTQKAAECLPQTKAVSKSLVKSYKDNEGVPWLPKNLCQPHSTVNIYLSDLRKEKH